MTTCRASRTSSRCSYALVHRAVRPVGEPGGRERGQHDGVADAAAGLLEVGLEQVRELAVTLGALARSSRAARAAAAGRRPASRSAARTWRGARRARRRPRAQVEQADGGRQVLGRHLPALRAGSGPSGRGRGRRPRSGTRAARPARRGPPALRPRPSCTSSRSRSLHGPASPRPTLPTAPSATPSVCGRSAVACLPRARPSRDGDQVGEAGPPVAAPVRLAPAQAGGHLEPVGPQAPHPDEG